MRVSEWVRPGFADLPAVVGPAWERRCRGCSGPVERGDPVSAPPGWHRQTDGRERFWDGEAWTEDFRGGSVLPVEPPPENGGSGGGFCKSWMGYLGAGLLGLLVGIMIGSSGGSDGSADLVAA